MAPLPGGFISHLVLRDRQKGVLENRKVFRRVVSYSDDYQLIRNFWAAQMEVELAEDLRAQG